MRTAILSQVRPLWDTKGVPCAITLGQSDPSKVWDRPRHHSKASSPSDLGVYESHEPGKGILQVGGALTEGGMVARSVQLKERERESALENRIPLMEALKGAGPRSQGGPFRWEEIGWGRKFKVTCL